MRPNPRGARRGSVRVVIFARGVISPPQRPTIYVRDRHGSRNFTRSKGGGTGLRPGGKGAPSERAARRQETSKSVTMGHIPVARLRQWAEFLSESESIIPKLLHQPSCCGEQRGIAFDKVHHL